jgi:hypothetical protein
VRQEETRNTASTAYPHQITNGEYSFQPGQTRGAKGRRRNGVNQLVGWAREVMLRRNLGGLVRAHCNLDASVSHRTGNFAGSFRPHRQEQTEIWMRLHNPWLIILPEPTLVHQQGSTASFLQERVQTIKYSCAAEVDIVQN